MRAARPGLPRPPFLLYLGPAVDPRPAHANDNPGFHGIEGVRGLHPGKRLTCGVQHAVAKTALALFIILASLCVVTGGSAVAAAFTWSGGGATTDPLWSNGSNWAGTAPSGTVDTLTFPLLTSPDCTATPATAACYSAIDDISGLSANAISIDPTAPYLITGAGLALGAGGISTPPPDPTSGFVLSFIDLPITLTAGQLWTIAGDANDSELAVASASGPYPLALALTGDARIGFGDTGADDTEIGPVTASGSGAIVLIGSLNATDGEPLSLTNGAGLAAPGAGATVGPVSATDGFIRVGYGDAPSDGTLAVRGTVALDSTSRMVFFIDQPGSTPGADFTQLTATGDIDLGGATLDLLQGVVGTGAACATLQPGDAYTLLSTTGTLTGTFAGLPDGATVALTSPCAGPSGAAPIATMTYGSNSVTATIDPAPTARLTTTPDNPVTNQPVTLTATVSAGLATPSGTITFEQGGTPIAGCAGESVVLTGAVYGATCTTTFSAASSPETLAAVFSPAAGSLLTGSTSSPLLLTVAKAATTTSVSVSSKAPRVGAPVTYSASVVPDRPGGAVPSGLVEFLDRGHVIRSCSSDALKVVSASCRMSYSGPGSHEVSARYLGDANFAGSSGAAELVKVTGGALPGNGSSTTVASPVFRRSAAVGAVSGTVRVRVPHSSRFVTLRRGALVPLGSTIDATDGTIVLVFARPRAAKASTPSLDRDSAELRIPGRAPATMWAQFWQGQFVITQTRSGMVIAVLAGGSFATCKRRPRGVFATVASTRPIRKLWARDHGGSFGTRGAYVATAVVGTEWLTEDFCAGSEVEVRQGTVRVTSLITHKTGLVHANHNSFVRA